MMRRRLRRLVWIGAFLVFLSGFTLLVISTENNYYQSASYKRQAQRADKDCRDVDGEPFWQRVDCDPAAYFTEWLTIFTAVLSGVSLVQFYFVMRADKTARETADAALRAATTAKIQADHMGNTVTETKRSAAAMENVAKAMNLSAKAAFENASAAAESARAAWSHSTTADQTVRIMKETAERQLRAYLAIATQSDPPGAALGGILIEEGQISVNLFIKNCGQTPAYGMRDWCNIAVLDEPLSGRIPKLWKRKVDAKSVIAPGQVITVSRKKRPGISANETYRIGMGSALIYVYGVITYKDAFFKKRYLKFRYTTNATSGTTDNLMICAEGNDAN